MKICDREQTLGLLAGCGLSLDTWGRIVPGAGEPTSNAFSTASPSKSEIEYALGWLNGDSSNYIVCFDNSNIMYMDEEADLAATLNLNYVPTLKDEGSLLFDYSELRTVVKFLMKCVAYEMHLWVANIYLKYRFVAVQDGVIYGVSTKPKRWFNIKGPWA